MSFHIYMTVQLLILHFYPILQIQLIIHYFLTNKVTNNYFQINSGSLVFEFMMTLLFCICIQKNEMMKNELKNKIGDAFCSFTNF
jgi:hypothetical protein